MMLAPGLRKMITMHGGLAVGEAGGADVLDRVVDVGDVGEADRRRRCGSAMISGRYSVGLQQLIGGVDLPALRSPSASSPFGRLALAAPSAAAHLVEADAVLG